MAPGLYKRNGISHSALASGRNLHGFGPVASRDSSPTEVDRESLVSINHNSSRESVQMMISTGGQPQADISTHSGSIRGIWRRRDKTRSIFIDCTNVRLNVSEIVWLFTPWNCSPRRQLKHCERGPNWLDDRMSYHAWSATQHNHHSMISVGQRPDLSKMDFMYLHHV